MTELTGQTIGRYRIIEQLGKGGMANVYRAVDIRLGRTVALKVIRAENLELTDFLERFDREARALARLNHPNIVHINDYGELNGLPYLEMDYIPGGTLENRLGVLIPWSESARFLAPVAFALDHAHEQGIIHRDVKPSNILISETGEPMITDFGIAKIIGQNQATLVTLPGFGVGTPAYMSPEQVMGKKVDGRSDVYSLGIVLYEMCTGHPPFRADTPMAVAVKQVHDPIPRPRRDLIPLPGAAEKAIMTALAKEPDERFATMGAFAATLETLGRKAPPAPGKATFTTIPIPLGVDLVESEENKAPPHKNHVSLVPFFSQNRTLTVILAMVIVAVVSTLIFGVGYAQRLISEQRVGASPPAAGMSTADQAGAALLALASATPTPTPNGPGGGTLSGLFPPGGSATATPSPTMTFWLRLTSTIQGTISGIPTSTPGNHSSPTPRPTSNPTAGSTPVPTAVPTNPPPTIAPTSPPPTVAPTSPPPTSPPATAVPTNPPAPTNTPKPVNTHKPPTKTP